MKNADDLKQILIKELCTRLPYEVKALIKANTCHDATRVVNISDLESFIKNTAINSYQNDCVISIKPYLRSLNNMTNKEKKFLNKIIYNRESSFTSPIPVWVINEDDIQKVVEFYNSHHLDWLGLIPLNIALEAPKGLYKIK